MGSLQRQGRGEFPVRFTPRGISDTFDSTDAFPGACRSLSDLVFDQANPEVMVSRPGVGTALTTFGSFTSPGVVSVQVTVGDITYGMISSAFSAARDEPFAWNNATSSFVAVAGVAAANQPFTQPTSGDWTPPTMASVGVFLIVTHPGFTGTANKFGWFDITNPAAPTWTAGDTATNGLSGVPTAVANFENRAYFSFGNKAEFTDVLTLTRTNASQSLTIGDKSAITAMSGLPVQTTSGGVIQALIIFKPFQIWQVTGDLVTNDLSQNFLSLTFGTESPRSVAQSPLGLYFASFAGPMIVDNLGTPRPVTFSPQQNEPDIQIGWRNMQNRSRAAAGYTGTIYRISFQTILFGQNVTVDYWFDEQRRRWTGPHSFVYDCLSQYKNYFILVSNTYPAAIYRSEIAPSPTSAYDDNGATIMSSIETATFPKTGHMAMKQVVESTMELASAASVGSFAITAVDDLGNTLNNCSVTILPAGSLWNSVVWGGFFWASATNFPTPYNVPWTAPLVFKKMALQIIATASASVAFGTFFARYRELGYTNNK